MIVMVKKMNGTIEPKQIEIGRNLTGWRLASITIENGREAYLIGTDEKAQKWFRDVCHRFYPSDQK